MPGDKLRVMTIENIRRYRNAKPFVPFALSRNDRRVIHVHARERIGFASWNKVGLFEGTDFHLFARAEISRVQIDIRVESSEF